MIKYTKTSIFETNSDLLINPVNCVGIMGKGLALEFKNRYPNMYKQYKLDCSNNLYKPGKLFLYNNIINFPTKVHWRDKSDIKFIEIGLNTFVRNINKFKNKSFSFPKLGTGCGKLSWGEVKPLMEYYLNNIESNIFYITIN